MPKGRAGIHKFLLSRPQTPKLSYGYNSNMNGGRSGYRVFCANNFPASTELAHKITE